MAIRKSWNEESQNRIRRMGVGIRVGVKGMQRFRVGMDVGMQGIRVGV